MPISTPTQSQAPAHAPSLAYMYTAHTFTMDDPGQVAARFYTEQYAIENPDGFIEIMDALYTCKRYMRINQMHVAQGVDRSHWREYQIPGLGIYQGTRLHVTRDKGLYTVKLKDGSTMLARYNADHSIDVHLLLLDKRLYFGPHALI